MAKTKIDDIVYFATSMASHEELWELIQILESDPKKTKDALVKRWVEEKEAEQLGRLR